MYSKSFKFNVIRYAIPLHYVNKPCATNPDRAHRKRTCQLVNWKLSVHRRPSLKTKSNIVFKSLFLIGIGRTLIF